MYVDESSVKAGSRTYTRYLLRESYREKGKVKHRTVGNLSHCSREEIEAIRWALRHKKELGRWIAENPSLQSRQGRSVGAVGLIFEVARQLGIVQALGPSRQGRLALWQVIARVLDQGSRLSAVRLAGSHAACDVLGIDQAFHEEDLYENLDWLCARQVEIERRLFSKLPPSAEPGLFLYDVTSSYLEGTENELAAFGYNRDGKQGKKQIVIGLLCNAQGIPLSIEVFPGNTQDPQTVASQIEKVAERFGASEVTFVGDRGMLKSRQVEALGRQGFHYITAITKAEIRTLLGQDVIQLELFDQTLAEVLTEPGIRYVIRRNPVRALEIEASRQDKLAGLRKKVEQRNAYLQEHPRARLEGARSKLQAYAAKLKIGGWVLLSGNEERRQITLDIDEAARAEASKLDGCYVLKTDLRPQQASKETVHDRYKDLSLVEQAFRTSKTVQLELRPIHVRLASHTRGHALVVMLAYRIVQELAVRWQAVDGTVQESLQELATLCCTELHHGDHLLCQEIPQPRPSVQRLLDAARVKLPPILPSSGVNVTTKKKLPERRKKN